MQLVLIDIFVQGTSEIYSSVEQDPVVIGGPGCTEATIGIYCLEYYQLKCLWNFDINNEES